MINSLFKVRRREEANDLFSSISASGLVSNASTYGVMIQNLLKEGAVEEADIMFASMEKSGCAPSSCLLNYVIRMLLEKGEIVKAANYMSKVDEKSISLEASTTSLMLSLFSVNGKYRDDMKLLPAKYQILMDFVE
jgi:pentatricopeptide repeat protein